MSDLILQNSSVKQNLEGKDGLLPDDTGKMPKVELYTTMERVGWHEQRAIVEQSVDGMEMIAGAVFTESTPESTEIEFHLAYKIPGTQLASFLGNGWALDGTLPSLLAC